MNIESFREVKVTCKQRITYGDGDLRISQALVRIPAARTKYVAYYQRIGHTRASRGVDLWRSNDTGDLRMDGTND
jgi:hypothetical protein